MLKEGVWTPNFVLLCNSSDSYHGVWSGGFLSLDVNLSPRDLAVEAGSCSVGIDWGDYRVWVCIPVKDELIIVKCLKLNCIKAEDESSWTFTDFTSSQIYSLCRTCSQETPELVWKLKGKLKFQHILHTWCVLFSSVVCVCVGQDSWHRLPMNWRPSEMKRGLKRPQK